jgi:hypothetical protein
MCFDPNWPQRVASPKKRTYVFSAGSAVQNSPLHCVSFTDRGEDRPVTT